MPNQPHKQPEEVKPTDPLESIQTCAEYILTARRQKI